LGILDYLFGKKASPAQEREVAGQPTVQRPVDWRTNEAHLYLLKYFLLPQDLRHVKQYNYLESELHELPHSAVQRFISEGVLVTASLPRKLLAAFTAAEIKSLLRQRGLRVSGTKEQCINRLVEADPKGIESMVSNLEIYECSEEAHEFATSYLSEKTAQRQAAEQRVTEQLRERDFQGAAITVASFEAKQVSPRGLNLNWSNPDTNRDVMILEVIFNCHPRILKNIEETELEPLRLEAAQAHLWGTNTESVSARMVMFHSSHVVEMATWRKDKHLNIKKFRISSSGDSCPACKKMAMKTYSLDNVPELPYEHCTHEMGCRCLVSPVFENLESD